MEQIFGPLETSSLMLSIFAGILIGLPTGPARFFVVDTCLNDGKLAALKVYGGFLSAALLYATLALIADDLISQNEKWESISYLVASILLIFWGIFIAFKSNKKEKSPIQINFGTRFMKGFIIGISNPVTPFVYLTFIQLLEAYSGKLSIAGNAFFILIFEIFSFLTTFVIALLLLKKKEKVLGDWHLIRILMGIFLIGLGSFQVYQQLDFRDGIKIEKNQDSSEDK